MIKRRPFGHLHSRATAAAAAAAAAEAVKATAETVGDYYYGHITHTIGTHCIDRISRNKL